MKYTHYIPSFHGRNGPAKTTDLNCFNAVFVVNVTKPIRPLHFWWGIANVKEVHFLIILLHLLYLQLLLT